MSGRRHRSAVRCGAATAVVLLLAACGDPDDTSAVGGAPAGTPAAVTSVAGTPPAPGPSSDGPGPASGDAGTGPEPTAARTTRATDPTPTGTRSTGTGTGSAGPKPEGTKPGGAEPGGTTTCGTPPDGLVDGRRAQAIVFPPPGVGHRWPDADTALRACATSGLPVTYALEGDPGNCRLRQQGGGWRVYVFQVVADCVIVASQQGDDRYAAAEPVRRPYSVGFQLVRASWSAPPPSTAVSGARVPVRVRITGVAPVDATFYLSGLGTCQDSPSQYVRGRSSYTLAFTVDVGAGPGTCTVQLGFQSDRVSLTGSTSVTITVT